MCDVGKKCNPRVVCLIWVGYLPAMCPPPTLKLKNDTRKV